MAPTLMNYSNLLISSNKKIYEEQEKITEYQKNITSIIDSIIEKLNQKFTDYSFNLNGDKIEYDLDLVMFEIDIRLKNTKHLLSLLFHSSGNVYIRNVDNDNIFSIDFSKIDNIVGYVKSLM